MRVLLRADGHHALGGGHVMRQLALAEALQRRGDSVHLVSARLDPRLEDAVRARDLPVLRFDAEPASQEDAEALGRLVQSQAADWVVLDGYDFSLAGVQTVQRFGARVLVIDDFLNRPGYTGDLLLNQNGPLELEADYRARGFRGRLLLGPRYALLRSEFQSLHDELRPIPELARRVLVTMGTADSVMATELALSALELVEDPELRVEVVIGPANPRGAALRARFTDPRFSWHEPARDMADLMQASELLVGAAGVTSLEVSCLGLPAMLMVLADNQERLAHTTHAEGAASNLGWYHALSPEALAARIQALRLDPQARRRMREAGRARVDARGAERVVQAMLEGAKG